jgi:hypothetical protein
VFAFQPKDASAVLEYLIILLITIAGMMRLTPWSAAAGAGILALLLLVERTRAVTSPRNVGIAADGSAASPSNMVYCVVAAFAAYFLGRTIGWLWGV